jgi:hypothetical protein
MEGHQLETGRTYAFREKRSTSSPMLKVRLLDKVGRKGKLKVRFEDGPHPGLEEYVSTRRHLCGLPRRFVQVLVHRAAMRENVWAAPLPTSGRKKVH